MMRQLKQPKRGNRGFTLVELMVVVALIGLVLTQGVPWLGTVTLNARRTVTVNSFVAHLNSARNFAISGDDQATNPCTGCEVAMCKSTDLLTCDTTAAIGWHDGWIMFWDEDTDGSFDLGTNERLIRVHEALEGDATMFGNAAMVNSVGFEPSGMLGSSAGAFIYCDSRGYGGDARGIVVSGVGRVRALPADDAAVSPVSCTP